MAGLLFCAEGFGEDVEGKLAELKLVSRFDIVQSHFSGTEQQRVDAIKVMVVAGEYLCERPAKVRRRTARYSRPDFFQRFIVTGHFQSYAPTIQDRVICPSYGD